MMAAGAIVIEDGRDLAAPGDLVRGMNGGHTDDRGNAQRDQNEDGGHSKKWQATGMRAWTHGAELRMPQPTGVPVGFSIGSP